MIEHLMKMEGLAKEALGTRGELKKIPTNKLIPYMVQQFADSGNNIYEDYPVLVDSITRELGKRMGGISNKNDIRRQVSDRVSQISEKFYPEHKKQFEQKKAAAVPKPQVSSQPKPAATTSEDPTLDKLKAAFISGSGDFHSALAEMERKAKAEELHKLVSSGKFDDARRLFDQMHGKASATDTSKPSPRDAVPNDGENAHELGFEQKQEKIVSLPDEGLVTEASPKQRASAHREATQQTDRTNTKDSPKKLDTTEEFDSLWNNYSSDPDFAHLKDYVEPHHLPLMSFELNNEFPGADKNHLHSMANHFIKRNKETADKQSEMEQMANMGKSPSLNSLKTKKKKIKDTSVPWAKEPEMPSSPPPAAQEKPKRTRSPVGKRTP